MASAIASAILGWKMGLELVWISYWLERGFCAESLGQILRDFACTIEEGHVIKVGTDAHGRST